MLDGEKMTETLSLEQAYTLPAGTENWEWEFGLYFKTKPTNSNCITVYPVKGADIYFQAGKNGYNDLFQFSVNGKEETFTFSFTEYEYKETEMSVRISLTDGDQWHIVLALQDRLNGRSERQSGQIEGKVDLPESAHFRYEVKHTKSNPKSLGVSQKIIMTEGRPSEPGEKPEEPDSSLITCLYIEPLSEDEVLYKFTDEVDKSYAAFSISGKGFDGKTEAVKEIYDDNDYSVIKVRFPNAMTLDEEYTFYGEIAGHIIRERRGSAGFGYDSVFVPEGYEETFKSDTCNNNDNRTGFVKCNVHNGENQRYCSCQRRKK